jgi:hypothetical protein
MPRAPSITALLNAAVFINAVRWAENQVTGVAGIHPHRSTVTHIASLPSLPAIGGVIKSTSRGRKDQIWGYYMRFDTVDVVVDKALWQGYMGIAIATRD